MGRNAAAAENLRLADLVESEALSAMNAQLARAIEQYFSPAGS